MFNKVVVVDDVKLNSWGKDKIKSMAKEVVFYNDFPTDEKVIIERINDADCLLVSFVTPITENIINSSPNLKYIGMCCSLYSEESSNVHIKTCKKRGIDVRGIFEYGDEGVVELAVSSLIWLLHGFGDLKFRQIPEELGGQNIGLIGLGDTGFKIAKGLQFFGANIFYNTRTDKPKANKLNMKYLGLHELLKTCDIIITQLPRNTFILGPEEFEIYGNNKIIFNCSIGPTFDVESMRKWLENPNNFYICDDCGIGDTLNVFEKFPNLIYAKGVSGISKQCHDRLSQKVVKNMENYLNNIPYEF